MLKKSRLYYILNKYPDAFFNNVDYFTIFFSSKNIYPSEVYYFVFVLDMVCKKELFAWSMFQTKVSQIQNFKSGKKR